ncbi:type IV pilus assembly protein PilA [Chitinasiproducens palmae]|uniref:Type IV pilus assembly protein PilA n=2 Tax=Chitinasiproducens palmae TaxID=1770053 RepID=A0A1H2PW53_9BURK|nr:type IV pilus assembly protein PilA [Chitinasiproducens palmae]
MAIVAVISAFAVPAYQDYLARSRVSEGLVLASMAQLAVTENASNGTAFEAGYEPPASTRNVESIEIDPASGQIAIAYQARVASPGSNVLVLVPSTADGASRGGLQVGVRQEGVLVWECFAAGKDRSQLDDDAPLPRVQPTLPGKLAPAECRG